MTEREKIIKVIDEWASKAVTTNKFDGASVYNPHNAAGLADALIAAGIALRGERMKYERLTKKICGHYHGKRFVGGKGVISDREYYRGCFDATAIVDRLGELEDKIEAGTLVELPRGAVYFEDQAEKELAEEKKDKGEVKE